MNPYDKAHELARALRTSEVFERLKSARERIEQDPATLEMVQNFRKLQWELQTKRLTGQQVSEADTDKLVKLAEVVQLNRDVSTYLEAEYQLTIVLTDLQQILGDTVEEAMLPVPLAESGEKELLT